MKKVKYIIVSGIIIFCFLLSGVALGPLTQARQINIQTAFVKTAENFQTVKLSENSLLAPVPLPFKTTFTSKPAPKAVVSSTGLMQISIPKIGVNAKVVQVGLLPNQELQVPGNSTQAGLYKYGSAPGDPGASIITGHMDFGKNFQPAVFYNLNKLNISDEIYVTRKDGSIAVFSVKSLEQYPQNNFPTKKVYSPSDTSELRIITCAGEFSKSTGRYTENLVVYAVLNRILPANGKNT